MLSPMLGDRFYSYRARMLMGHMTPISHKHSPHNHTQVLPGWMLEALGIKASETALLPKHLHLMRVHLPSYRGKGKDLNIYANPPEFFLSTSHALGVKVPNGQLIKTYMIVVLLYFSATFPRSLKATSSLPSPTLPNRTWPRGARRREGGTPRTTTLTRQR